MTTLRARAPGKVNLCLLLGPRREDGRHELVSVVAPLSLADELELAPAPRDANGDEVVCPGVEGENLAARALAGYRRATGWDAPPQRLTIAKRVPIAAGMGGGSGDAAAALRLAVRAAGREDDSVLADLAAELGSDVPAQLIAGPSLVTGAGENVRALDSLSPYAVVVVPSPRRLATADVFAQADRMGLARSAAQLGEQLARVQAALESERTLPDDLIVNDLEPAARSLCPEIDAALEGARAAGADRVLVAGSGPTVFGVMWGNDAARRARAAADELAPRFHGACAVEPVGGGFADPVETSA
jgi:4-diphosphocytidyl-2-C-methyl-D-erythritol kinase